MAHERLAKIYNQVFWFCVSSSVLLSVLSLIGCADLQAGLDAASKPGPDGNTAITKAVDAIPEVIANPLNIPAWLQITGLVGTIAGAAFAAHARGKHTANTDAIDAVAETVSDLANHVVTQLKAVPPADPAAK